jgi:hypothetical protein
MAKGKAQLEARQQVAQAVQVEASTEIELV